jgi:predicted MFS family arabinose efflux permease
MGSLGVLALANLISSGALPLMAPVFAGLPVSGLSGWLALLSPQQDRLISVVGTANTPVALSLNASFTYVGFSLGALLGSIVIAASSVI